ncbi:MAG TPA: DNA repair protein RecN, partial [Longimicrobiales bacterium]
MLLELRIQGYAVIDDLSLQVGPGLNVLTGETGAGKSIVVGALSLLLGERASPDVVRTGADRAVVEAVFDITECPALQARLDELGYDVDPDLLILKREVHAEGRSRAWVGGSPATATVVWELGSALVDLHGQHEHQTLVRRDEQRQVLDAYAEAQELAASVGHLHEGVRELEEERERQEVRRRELEAQADFLRFQLDEIDAAGIDAEADGGLDGEARRLEHARELAETSARLHELLYEGDDSVAEGLAEAREMLARVAGFDPSLAEHGVSLEEAYHRVVEAGRALGDYASEVEQDPGRLEEVRRRQDLLFRLRRKYGPELTDVMETGERVRAELDELRGTEHDIEHLEVRLAELQRRLVEEAQRLTAARTEASARLAGEVMDVLPELGMPGGVFEVGLDALPRPGPHGGESVEFRVAVNPGFEPRPLARVASGGELSRIMLALKSILARVDRVPTLVFDEIDAGIGGVVATGVAEKLAQVARLHQVFVITHLPQLASRARAHLRVEKVE